MTQLDPRQRYDFPPEYEPEETAEYVEMLEAHAGDGMTDEYLAWLEEQDARGELAGAPETMDCYGCGGFDGVTAVERKVVKLGPVAEAHRDPTQTYVLDCGHVVI